MLEWDSEKTRETERKRGRKLINTQMRVYEHVCIHKFIDLMITVFF